MVAGLRGQQTDLVARHVRHVRREDVDAAPQTAGERVEQVAGVDLSAERGDIAAGAAHGGRVDVRRVQLRPAESGRQGRADRARAAAQVHDDGLPGSGSGPGFGPGLGLGPCRGQGLFYEELGAPAGYEDTRFHGDPQAAELRPPDDELEGQPGCPAFDQRGDVTRGRRGGDDQFCLVLGEDASGGPECGHHGVTGGRCGGEGRRVGRRVRVGVRVRVRVRVRQGNGAFR